RLVSTTRGLFPWPITPRSSWAASSTNNSLTALKKMNAETPQNPSPEAPQETVQDQTTGAPEGVVDPAQRIAELEALVETLKNERLLALAEAENAGKRADKRIADNAKYAVSNIAKALLQVADNLGRALLAAPADARADNDTLKNLALGVEL